ncbi:MAG: hypothetical protein KJ623_00085 [Nanoarchaeota archaeon]|nr:hypothetical protein [Nanoarchaeota archaeon]MBU0962365.1 hypothetical protein [Nanoarchaeota archaeon]
MKRGSIHLKNIVSSIGFGIIAIGGAYASITKNFSIGTLIIAIGGVVLAIAQFL